MTPKIVVVDDEPELLLLVCAVLEDEGIRAVGISDPGAVLSDDTLSDANLFLIDMMLPGMDGINLARRLRMDGMPDTPMIAMSASAPMLQRAADSGLFRGTLSKPFDLRSLLGSIERTIRTGLYTNRARYV